MEKKSKQGYGYAVIMGLFTILVCLVIADGVVGIEGVIRDYKEFEDGHHEFALVTSNPTGRIIFWIGLLGLPVLFYKKIKVRHAWINLPLYLVAWYSCSWMFGESVKHRYLAHPARGFISFGDTFVSLWTTFLMWAVQAIVLWTVSGLCFMIRKIADRLKEGKE